MLLSNRKATRYAICRSSLFIRFIQFHARTPSLFGRSRSRSARGNSSIRSIVHHNSSHSSDSAPGAHSRLTRHSRFAQGNCGMRPSFITIHQISRHGPGSGAAHRAGGEGQFQSLSFSLYQFPFPNGLRICYPTTIINVAKCSHKFL